MFIIILIMAAGIGIGYLCRHRSLNMINRCITLLIWLLLFLLGVEVGGNHRIINGIASLGAEALLVAVAAVAGCGLFSLVLWKIYGKSSTKASKAGNER